VPLVLPMGWKQSPPLFTAATEIVADLANGKLQAKASSPAHRLDDVSESTIQGEVPDPATIAGPASLPAPMPPSSTRTQPRPVKAWGVYDDDFIGMVQGGPLHRRHVKRVLLHSLDEVIRRLDPSDSPHRQEPASLKKVLKGDATWAIRKIVLGWQLDTLAMTIHLPAHRVIRLFELLDSFPPSQRRTTVVKWKKFLG
jgi:hypothetical protein